MEPESGASSSMMSFLDIDSREWIEEAVEEYGGNLLFVSHDRYFIEKFATRVWIGCP